MAVEYTGSRGPTSGGQPVPMSDGGAPEPVCPWPNGGCDEGVKGREKGREKGQERRENGTTRSPRCDDSLRDPVATERPAVYEYWKLLHVSMVYLSLAGFALRGVWMLMDSPLRQTRPAKVLPHIIDTLLLTGAIGLMVVLGAYPFVQGWLTAKVLALLAYIALGMVAFRFGLTKPVRAGAFVAALVAFGYMLAVAYTRNPWPLG